MRLTVRSTHFTQMVAEPRTAGLCWRVGRRGIEVRCPSFFVRVDGVKDEPRHEGGRALCAVALAGAILALAVSGAFGAAAASATPYTRHLKLQLLHAESSVPELVIYGGSRAEKGEPGYFESLTGIPGFNGSVMSCRPADVLAYSKYLHDLAPGTRQFPVWFLSIEVFRVQQIAHVEMRTMPGLLAYLPADILADITPLAPVAFTPPPDLVFPDGNAWRTDGSLRVSRYDVAVWNGVSREKLLATRLKQYLRNYANFAALDQAPEQMIERAIAQMNSWRWKPVIVLPPYSPELLAALKQHGWDTLHRQTLAYLADLQTRHKLVVVDLSYISSFGGWSSGLYDGVHGNTAIMRAVERAIVSHSDRALDPVVPYGVRR